MSAEHHESSAESRLLAELLHIAKPRFPLGKLNEHDDGEIAFAVAADLVKKVIILRCAKPVDWLGLSSEAARHLAGLLNEKAQQVEDAS